jgi:hypothetical protein
MAAVYHSSLLLTVQAERDRALIRLDRAERSLLRAGFEDLGGQEWEPPMGKPPRFVEVAGPLGREVLNDFIDKFCLGDSRLIACAESAFYAFNNAAAQKPTRGISIPEAELYGAESVQ